MNVNFFKGEIFQSEFNELVEDLVYRNYVSVLVPIDGLEGKFWQIDNLLLTTKGIFCVELKNYNALYEGGATDLFIQSPTAKGRVKNPIRQNKQHRLALEHHIPDVKIQEVCVVRNVKPDITGELIYNMEEFIDSLIYGEDIYNITELKEIDSYVLRFVNKYSTGKPYHY